METPKVAASNKEVPKVETTTKPSAKTENPKAAAFDKGGARAETSQERSSRVETPRLAAPKEENTKTNASTNGKGPVEEGPATANQPIGTDRDEDHNMDHVGGKSAKNDDDEEMTDAPGDFAPEDPKGNDNMDVDQQISTAAGHAGQATRDAGRPPVTEAPKAVFSMSNGTWGAAINHGAARVSNGAPYSSNSTGIKPDLNRAAAKGPIGASQSSIFDGFKFDLNVPIQSSTFQFGSPRPTPAATPIKSSFNPSMTPIGPIPARSPQESRSNFGIEPVKGSLGGFANPKHDIQPPSGTNNNGDPASTTKSSTPDNDESLPPVTAEEIRAAIPPEGCTLAQLLANFKGRVGTGERKKAFTSMMRANMTWDLKNKLVKPKKIA